MYINAGNAGVKKRSKVQIASFQKPNARSVRFQYLKSARWVCPKQERYAMSAAMIPLTGGSGSFGRLMKARCGSSGARNAGRHGGSIIKNIFQVFTVSSTSYSSNISPTSSSRISSTETRPMTFVLLSTTIAIFSFFC